MSESIPIPVTAPTPAMARLAHRARMLASRDSLNLAIEMSRAAFKLNDQNTILGALWSLASPVIMLIALYFIFRDRLGARIPAYPLYLLLGIVLTNFFATTTRIMLTALSGNRSLLLNSTVPREILLLFTLVVPVSKLLIELGLCALLSMYYGLFSPVSLLRALPVLASFLALVMGVGMIVALLHCFARDIEHIWSIATRMLFFVTPVFYALESLSLPARRAVVWLNPITPHLIALRSVFMGTADGLATVHALAAGSLLFAIGYAGFLKLEGKALERA